MTVAGVTKPLATPEYVVDNRSALASYASVAAPAGLVTVEVSSPGR